MFPDTLPGAHAAAVPTALVCTVGTRLHPCRPLKRVPDGYVSVARIAGTNASHDRADPEENGAQGHNEVYRGSLLTATKPTASSTVPISFQAVVETLMLSRIPCEDASPARLPDPVDCRRAKPALSMIRAIPVGYPMSTRVALRSHRPSTRASSRTCGLTLVVSVRWS